MTTCLLCGQEFTGHTTILQIFSVKKKKPPVICLHCRQRFTPLSGNRCQVCSREWADGDVCNDCRAWGKFYGKNLLYNHSLYHYNDAFHDLMVNYKRYGDYVLYAVLQELCGQEVAKIVADLYVPVPTSPEHRQKRQFDTVSAIYQELVPLTFLLDKKPGGGAQGEKNKRERMRSKQSFIIRKNDLAADFSGKILLLDDIYTTGRTLYHARDKLLTVFPQAKISSFSICR
ncbi:double zinc ribbon domain-containing protein [Lactobacillus sp. ESL0791]|uniref:ComF family protein n=1 Tax=Lactobacillus sp. ESL0791 TaxID=2983234 RepID=UPI0023F78037|nr:double zinc ribbon domain-containing protein [Lactobacillus sp. ESL0791]MDF7638572.1 double zinc ribbon domain-containing protein [Lactobacillus sp. ESL0791]